MEATEELEPPLSPSSSDHQVNEPPTFEFYIDDKPNTGSSSPISDDETTSILIKEYFLEDPYRNAYNESKEAISGYGDHVGLLIDVIYPLKPDINVLLKKQNRFCASCSSSIYYGVLFAGYRYCNYTGKLYCLECHHGESNYIPSRVVQLLDCRPYAICDFVERYLCTMNHIPVISLSFYPINHMINNRKLTRLRVLKMEFVAMSNYIRTCKDNRLILSILGKKSYLLDDNDLFSIEDFVSILEGPGLNQLEDLEHKLILHITGSCVTCKAKGFICDYCQHASMIYPFQVNEVVTCKKCKGVFHRLCYSSKTCPKCKEHRVRKKQYIQSSTVIDPL